MSRFISRLGEKALPLYKLLKKTEKFTWTAEADVALEELKKMLQEHQYSPPLVIRNRCFYTLLLPREW